MPTLRGWLCAIIGGSCISLGWVFGLVELYVIGAVLVALAVLALLLAVLRPLQLGVGRSVTPARLHVGSVGRVEIAVRNGASKTPVMRMTDRVQGTGGAQLFMSPLDPDGVARAAYRLPTERRGIVTVGPVDFESTDPFGLAIRRFTAPSIGKLVVYPEVIPIPAAPPSPANERRSTSDQPEFLGGRSEEFHALRQYVPGDDVRRINWRASARHDDLIVREDESPTQNHLTVLLDNSALKSGPPLDRGASVAASILTSMRSRTDPFRLITAGGDDSEYVLGASGLDTTLSILATVDEASGDTNKIDPAVSGAQGALVVVTARAWSVDPRGLLAYGRVMFIALEPSVWDPALPMTPSSVGASGREITLRLSSMDALASLWTTAITTLMSSGSGH